MKITMIGHGSEHGLCGEHLVFCVIDHTHVVASTSYPDKQEYGMYWFEEWVQNEIDRNGGEVFTLVDEYSFFKEHISSWAAITRIEKPKPHQTKYYDDDVYGLSMPKQTPKQTPYVRPSRIKVGRNHLCECGSGKKYKKCCINKVRS